MPQKKVFVARNLKDWTKFTAQMKNKNKIKFFYRDNFMLP